MCKLIERFPDQLGCYEQPMREAAIFSMAPKPRLGETLSERELRIINDGFFLPFENTVISTPEVAVLISTNQERRGLPYMAMTVAASKHPEGIFFDTGVIVVRDVRARDRDGYEVLYNWSQGPVFVYDSRTQLLDARSADEMVTYAEYASAVLDTDITARLGFLAAFGIARTIAFNRPHHHVLEMKDVEPRPVFGSRIPRKNERPAYTTIKPHVFRRMCRLAGVISESEEREHSGKCSHWRRQHYRHLHSDRFVSKRGQTIVVPSTWIGPTEILNDNGKRYRVLTDI
jgi:hypothetical protein